MFGCVMCQLFSTRVRRSPFFGSRWSQSKQMTFLCLSVSDSYRSLTTDSGTAGALPLATSATSAQAGVDGLETTDSAAAPVAPRNARRDRPFSRDEREDMRTSGWGKWAGGMVTREPLRDERGYRGPNGGYQRSTIKMKITIK